MGMLRAGHLALLAGWHVLIHFSTIAAMDWSRHIGRLVACVIVMIALLGASSVAEAHGRHHHGAASRIASPVAADIDAAVLADSVPAQKAALFLEVDSSKDSSASPACSGGCCNSASHACCGVSLPIGIALPLPMLTGAAEILSPPGLRDGIDPDALHKPPRSST